MAPPFPQFDRSRLQLEPLAQRRHDWAWPEILPLQRALPVREPLQAIAAQIVRARSRPAAVILMLGAHVLRSGVQDRKSVV